MVADELKEVLAWNRSKKTNIEKACKSPRPHAYTAYNGVRVTDKRHAYDKEYLEKTHRIIKSRQEAEL